MAHYTVSRAFMQKGESATASDISEFLIFLAVILAFLLMIGILHPGI